MKPPFQLILAFAGLTVAPAMSGADVAAPPGAGSAADAAWAALVSAAAKPHRITFPPGTKANVAAVAAQRRQFALDARSVATAAHSFYTQFPSHSNAVAARKMEALQALQGVTDDDPAYEASAQKSAASFRSDLTVSPSDRFPVATAAEQVISRARLAGAPYTNVSAELERIADKLRVEFGDLPEVYGFYASIARGADMATARRLANSLKQWPASAAVKRDADTMLQRDALLGKPLGWSLTAIDGTVLPLDQQQGKITVIYAWSPRDSVNGLPILRPLTASFPADAQMVYLALSADAETARVAASSSPIPGRICYEPKAALGPTAAGFQLQHTPYAFVLKRDGTLSGYGPLSELSNLIAAAAK